MPSELAFLRPPMAALTTREGVEVGRHRIGERVALRQRIHREHLQHRADAGRAELGELLEHEGAQRGPAQRARPDGACRDVQRGPATTALLPCCARGHVFAAFIRSTKAASSARGA